MTDTLDDQWVPTLNPHYRLQWEPAQNNYVLLYPEGMIKFNPSAGIILSKCDGEMSLAGIIQNLSTQFPDAHGLAQDVRDFFNDARLKKWVL